MRPKNIEAEAKSHREKAAVFMRMADDLDAIATIEPLARQALERVLESQVAFWRESRCWDALDDEAKREQGRALQSRELLGYIQGASDRASGLREEAQRLIAIVEKAADQGRIARA